MVAAHLVDAAQYDLANELFERFEPEELDYADRVMYASSYSEDPPGRGRRRPCARAPRAGDRRGPHRFATGDAERSVVLWRSASGGGPGCSSGAGSSRTTPRDLDAAIGELERALAQMLETRRLAAHAPAGLIAQIRVKLMLHLRIRDGDAQRPDVGAARQGRADRCHSTLDSTTTRPAPGCVGIR